MDDSGPVTQLLGSTWMSPELAHDRVSCFCITHNASHAQHTDHIKKTFKFSFLWAGAAKTEPSRKKVQSFFSSKIGYLYPSNLGLLDFTDKYPISRPTFITDTDIWVITLCSYDRVAAWWTLLNTTIPLSRNFLMYLRVACVIYCTDICIQDLSLHTAAMAKRAHVGLVSRWIQCKFVKLFALPILQATRRTASSPHGF